MGPVETYLSEMCELRSARAGVEEITYYTALANLLDEVGKTLKPKVRSVLQLKNRGAGNPDGGLFTADQFPKSGAEPAGAGIPARGAIEIKSHSDDAWITADGEQVSKYWGRYNQVLVTNYRDFVLVGRDPEGRQIKLETYRLVRDEAEFWADARHPAKKASVVGESFIGFLKRGMLLSAPLDSASDLAVFLASYAHEAKFRIEHGEYPSLATVRTALEEALGMTFEGTKGDHFFRSTLVQTLFYGMFSAWVLWSKSHPSRTARFDWRLSDQHLRVPILRKLFREVADPGAMESMDLNEVLDWAAATLNRVDRAKFFETFEERHAVQYFYEPFLEAFDPELRKDLGIWYTPTEIVDYMVERVDRVLREELALPDGLADPNVYVLDPCCGTGAYLVSVLNRIAETLRQKGGDALLAQDLKEAAINRVFGFEILPAPFVVAHLQLGLLMQHLGAPFSDKGKKERASVFLTNSLTSWEPPVKPNRLPFVELEEERDAADVVKREKPILVILGNPPYNSFAGIAKVTEERGLSDAYRVVNNKKVPAPQGQGLNDLYVRFFRMAERRIVEKTGAGVVCFISNYSWLDGLSFTAMRERYLEVFDRIWIDNLNGDKYKTGKLTPEGKPDPSAFSTEFNREGIQVGTAVSLLVRKHDSHGADAVRFRQMWGKEKLAELLASKEHDGKQLYQNVAPKIDLGLPFAPTQVEADYLEWPLLPELSPISFPGVKTSRSARNCAPSACSPPSPVNSIPTPATSISPSDGDMAAKAASPCPASSTSMRPLDGLLLPPPFPFEEYYAGGHRYVERGDFAGQGNAHQHVAVLAHLLVQTAAFAAEHEDAFRRVIDLVVGLGAALIQAVNPHAALLEVFQGAVDVGDAHHRQMFQRARRSLGHDVGDARRAALRDDDGAGAGGVRGADDGAQIVRIFHAVEHHQHLGRGDGIEVGVLARRAEGDDALMGRAAGQPVQGGTRLKANGHAGAARQVDDLLQTRTAGALRDHDALQGVAGAQGLGNGMNATE